MPKKRRITPDQARLFAITLIQQALQNEMEFGTEVIPSEMNRPEYYFHDYIPENWMDGDTSQKSWDLLWDEMQLELLNILKGLDREAVRIKVLNPALRYTVQYPLSNNGVKPEI